jgi:hypothetical protein
VYRVLIFSARERASAGLRRGLSRNATKFINPERRVRKSPDGLPNDGPIAVTIRQDPSSAGSIGFSDRAASTLRFKRISRLHKSLNSSEPDVAEERGLEDG